MHRFLLHCLPLFKRAGIALLFGISALQAEISQKSFELLMNCNHYGAGPYFAKADWEEFNWFQNAYLERLALIAKPEKELRIPKRLHFIWLGPKEYPKRSWENLRSWKSHHPDWECIFWTDKPERKMEIAGIQVRNAEEMDLGPLKLFYNKSSNWAEKADLLRYRILNELGGVYIDHDIFCFRPFDLLHTNLDFYAFLEIPHYLPGYPLAIVVNNGLFGSIPHHPILRELQELVGKNWETYEKKYPGLAGTFPRVLHQTFLPFTQSVKKHLTERALIFPAAGLYPLDLCSLEIKEYIQKGACWAFHTQAGVWLETGGEKNLKELFNAVYENQIFQDFQKGSFVPAAEKESSFLIFLSDFLSKHPDIHSIIQWGCGPWDLYREFDWKGCNYTGFDSVSAVVRRNREKFEKENVKFEVIDWIGQELPAGDLLICKDVFPYLSIDKIQKLLSKFKDYKYLIYVDESESGKAHFSPNTDTKDGEFRCIQLSKPPFQLQPSGILSFPTGDGKKEVVWFKKEH